MEGRPHNHGGKILSELGLAATGSGGFRLESTFKPTGDAAERNIPVPADIDYGTALRI